MVNDNYREVITNFVHSISGFQECDEEDTEDCGFQMCLVSYTAWIAFGYPNNRVSERCPVLIDSDKRRSTVVEMRPSVEPLCA
ncbi:hypothetical protein TNCV_1378881 [Trichonephila clavipes]|nr:hypothetical protein TNCV_1378881 [Trichonephila clavipes]